MIINVQCAPFISDPNRKYKPESLPNVNTYIAFCTLLFLQNQKNKSNWMFMEMQKSKLQLLRVVHCATLIRLSVKHLYIIIVNQVIHFFDSQRLLLSPGVLGPGFCNPNVSIDTIKRFCNSLARIVPCHRGSNETSSPSPVSDMQISRSYQCRWTNGLLSAEKLSNRNV